MPVHIYQTAQRNIPEESLNHRHIDFIQTIFFECMLLRDQTKQLNGYTLRRRNTGIRLVIQTNFLQFCRICYLPYTECYFLTETIGIMKQN
jgi:hypothetical protein